MAELSVKYQEKMKEYLKDEYQAYLDSFAQPAYHGLRVNTNKISVEDFLKIFPYELKPIPWTSDGFYYNEEDPVTKHPYYHAGLYYVQEPSAMLPGESLPVEPGERVLDVCAAPGGKSTKLACKLQQEGILFANDISVSRSRALLRNLERFGTRNAFVMSEDPEKLKDYFEGYFDKILIDAPCSGEGMFRKDTSLIRSYEERDSSYYVPIQKSIVKSCLSMLKDGGMMVYSTCTFSEDEDEEIIRYAIETEPSLKVIKIPYCEGFVQNEYGTKLFPHRIHGEGHFVSLLCKGEVKENKKNHKTEIFKDPLVFLGNINGSSVTLKDKKYIIPDTGMDLKGLRLLRSGLLVGVEKKGRFEYEQAFAMALRKEECHNVIDFVCDDERVMRYLKGETIDISDQNVKDGYALVCVDSYPLGFAKVQKNQLKNKIDVSWIVK